MPSPKPSLLSYILIHNLPPILPLLLAVVVVVIIAVVAVVVVVVVDVAVLVFLNPTCNLSDINNTTNLRGDLLHP